MAFDGMQELDGHIKAFIRYARFEKRFSEHTIVAYAADLEQFRAYMDNQYQFSRIEEIGHVHIRSWLVSLKSEGLADSSLHRKASTLKSFYKYLLRLGEIGTNPVAKVRTPKKARRLPVYLEEEQTADWPLLIEEVGLEALTVRLILEMLYQTGIRRTELAGLKQEDVDFQRAELRVWGKRNKERIVPLSRPLLDAIRIYIDEKKKELGHAGEALLVLGSGKPLYVQYIYRTVKKYLAVLTTQDKKSPHVLRHTFATHLSNQGADLNAIKELLGHASLAATQVYTHNNIERLKEVYRKAHPKS